MQAERSSFDRAGVDVVAIGQGRGSEAAGFAERWEIAFPILGDPTGAAYRDYGFTRGSLWSVMLKGLVARPLESMRAIARADLRAAALPASDVLRLGGVAAVAKGGRLVALHRAADPADIPTPDEVLAALAG